MELLFPNENKYNAEILKASQETGVPVAVIKGFCALESNFNPNSVKDEAHLGDASYGLMQILYKTAQGVGYRGQPDGLFDPYQSLLYGCKFLKGLLDKYPKLTDAIASYNMGFPRTAENTTRIIEGIYGKPDVTWIYANQPYVDRVSAYIAYYQTFEKPNEQRRAEILDALKKKDYATLRSISNLYTREGTSQNPALS